MKDILFSIVKDPVSLIVLSLLIAYCVSLYAEMPESREEICAEACGEAGVRSVDDRFCICK